MNLKIYINTEDLHARIKELAMEINKDFAGKEVTIVCVLKGGVMFFADIAKHLDLDLKYDFLDVSSYHGGTTSTGVVKFNKDLDEPITGKNVILIEDIIDTGRSLAHIVEHLKSQKPNILRVCTLLDKPDRREVFDVKPEYIGFKIPDKFIVGYGLDLDEKYRNLDYIGYFE